MSSALTVGSWVTIRNGCPISCIERGDTDVVFIIGDQKDGFEVLFESAALREFVRLSSTALEEMDTLPAQPSESTGPS